MTAAETPPTHHHPAGMPCVACIVAGIDVTPSDLQARRIRLAARTRNERAT